MAIVGDALVYVRSAMNDEHKLINLICYILLFWGLNLVFLLQFITASYGRYSRSGWGIQIPCKVAWIVQELPSFLVPVYLIVNTDCPRASQWRNQIALGLYLFHYFQRAFIFPILIRGGKPTSFVPFAIAVVFCTTNGYIQGKHLLSYADLQSTTSEAQFYLGILLFFTGMIVNIHSDHILRNLRTANEQGYKIPYGGMFEYVSGANFFGETLEWLGFAIACGTLPTITFAVFTACNVGPRACQHHRWYLRKFEDYPKNRKAFIPFIV